jgi:hypothetical protein
MIAGYNHLTQTQENKWTFYAAGNSWQIWDKPDGCNFIHIVAIGAGSGGGGGYQRAAAANGGGGGGGASGPISTMMIPAYVLPDKLYIQVGTGGAGGANLTAGSAAGSTYIGLVPDSTNTLSNILFSITITSLAAGGASNVTGGNAGAGNRNTTSIPFFGWGKVVNVIAGQGGQAGTSPSTDLAQTLIIGGGAAGAFAAASTQAAGRSVTSSYKQPSAVTYSVGQAVGVSGSAGEGPNLISPQPQFFGGSGGAALTTTNTAGGGNGGIGCGGGGAGPNLTGGSSTGGRGGDGMVIITCW